MGVLKRNEVGSLTNPKVAQVIIRGALNDGVNPIKNCLNVWHFWRALQVLPVSAENIATALQTALKTNLLAATNEAYTIVSWDCRFVDDPASALFALADGDGGAIGTDPYDFAEAVMMTMKTGFRGRSFRGSKHFGGLSEADTTANRLTGTGLTNWQNVQDDINAIVSGGMTDLDGNVWKLIILSPTLSDLEAVPAVMTFAEVSSVVLNQRIGSMDRRRVPSLY